LFAGLRYDSFDLTALDLNSNITRNRVDEKISPRAAIIVKPVDNLSIYTRLQYFLSAGVRRPVQRPVAHHADPDAAEI
jgi:outer membrane receptor protein involved in Fe transport